MRFPKQPNGGSPQRRRELGPQSYEWYENVQASGGQGQCATDWWYWSTKPVRDEPTRKVRH